jgi:polyisoprenyl-teichoic acid--peptidoglycan teichoic acid transferase
VNEHGPTPPKRHHPAAGALLVTLLALFVGGGLYSGWLFLNTVRALLQGTPPPPPPRIVEIGSVDIPNLGRPSAKPTATLAPGQPSPTPLPAEQPLPTWDGKDRVTILLLGIDQREDEEKLPTRSDTMMLLTVDPVNFSAGLISIPRDLWVPLGRGREENKINTAHFFGELEKPGSGPEAARRTVSYNFGVPINYYARVDFHGFEHLVDAIGGVTIDVDRAILDNEYPNEKYGITRVYIPAGPQHMSGLTALRYARSRHADSDFGRSARQRKVLQAARDEVLTLNLIPKLPSMFLILKNAVTTDIPWTSMLALADLGRKVPSTAIESRAVDDTMIIDVNRDGSVLVPDREKIRQLVQAMFYDPQAKKEAAKIELLNGTGREGLASNTKTALQAYGIDVARVESADRTNYTQTVILDHRGKPATVKRLAALLGVPAANVRSDNAVGDVDVTIILGSDFRGVQ